MRPEQAAGIHGLFLTRFHQAAAVDFLLRHRDGVPKNLTLAMADEWAFNLYDRAVCAHMRGEARLALASLRELEKIRPALMKLLVPGEGEKPQPGDALRVGRDPSVGELLERRVAGAVKKGEVNLIYERRRCRLLSCLPTWESERGRPVVAKQVDAWLADGSWKKDIVAKALGDPALRKQPKSPTLEYWWPKEKRDAKIAERVSLISGTV